MKANAQQKQAMVGVMAKIAGEIAKIEQAFGLEVGKGDVRPRIEYFHDAVRAYTQGRSTGYESEGRLSVESLAWDVNGLRELTNNPISRHAVRPGKESFGQAVVVFGEGKPAYGAKPDSTVRYKLADLYKHYTVLFVALLTEAADRNYYSRIEERNAEVEELAGLEHATKNKKNADVLALMNKHIHDDDLKKKIRNALVPKPKARPGAEVAVVKNLMKAADSEIARVEKAHLHYCSAQLSIYEGAKELIKKMAGQGVNVVGDFVASAMAEAQRGARGR